MNLIEQSIENCHMTHKYENPGIENGMCAGLRMLCGQGEPCEECKECKLHYLYAEEHDIKIKNADRIRSMSDEELAEFIEQVSTDSMETISFGTKEYKEVWEHKETALKWLQSDVEN